MSQKIKATRSELMKLKKKIKLAKSGHALLKKKRDGLIMEFFEILKVVKQLRQQIVDEYVVAQKKMAMARMLESDLNIKSIATAISQMPDIELKTKNVMGVVVPTITSPDVKKKLTERGYGLFNSVAIDETAVSYENVVEKVMVAAEVETSMKKILTEIEKTKRRVNALEFAIIPQLNKERAFISLRLEEMERENIFRLKRIKKGMSGSSEEAEA